MIVRAGPEHAVVLAALHARSFAAPWAAEEFATLLGQPGVAAWLRHGNEPDGFILVRAVADEAEILTLAVVPAHRRTGAASALLKIAVETLRAGGTARIFLEVAADNAAALALYKQHAFTPCGRRADYYGQTHGGAPVDAVVMMRLIESKS